MAKGSGRAKRIVTHLPKAKLSANTVHYTLQKTAKNTRTSSTGGEADARTAYARVLERESISRAELEAYIIERHHLLKAETIHYVVDILLDAIMQQLRAGRRVNFEEAFSFGVSFEGRINPERPFDVRHLPLHPWVRFTQPFINQLNTNVRIAYADPMLPPSIEVKSLRNLGFLLLGGKFRHPEALAADILLPTGEVIPCSLDVKSSSTRKIHKLLPLIPDHKFETPAILRLTWIDGGEDERVLDLDIPPQETPGKKD